MGNCCTDGQQKRLIRAQHEDRSLAPLAPGTLLPKQLTPLHIPAMAFGHPQLKVFLRLPYGLRADKVQAFHLFIARTNNSERDLPGNLRENQRCPA